MEAISNSVWQRRGSCILFDQKSLGPFIADGAVISLRQALVWSRGLPANSPVPGRTILISGLETVVETMEPREAEDFLSRRIRPLLILLQNRWTDCGVVFGFTSHPNTFEETALKEEVLFRRTKADACAQDGGPLFVRRMVHTEGFELSEREKAFYNALLDYLRDGYNLAVQQGNKGRALGFVMTVFQKIAASSFGAIRSTLQRRLLMLTIQEGIERDELLDVDGRNRAFEEARRIIHEIHSIPDDSVGSARADQILADAKYQLLKKRSEALSFATAAEGYSDSEYEAGAGEESAAMLVVVALPEERQRILDLLAQFPDGIESKTVLLVHALRQIWRQNPQEKVVIFATYLGTVEAIKKQLGQEFPGAGVDVLKGGDHGAKTAASPDRPDSWVGPFGKMVTTDGCWSGMVSQTWCSRRHATMPFRKKASNLSGWNTPLSIISCVTFPLVKQYLAPWPGKSAAFRVRVC